MIAELTTERLPIAELKPHPKNPRIHPEEGSSKWEILAASLEHDYFDPLVWNRRNGMLVSGHFRAKIFASQGVTHVDVVVVDYDEPTHLARMIAANRPFGEDDNEKQRLILQELSDMGSAFDWDITALDVDSLANFGVDLGGGGLFEESSPFVEKEPETSASTTERPAAPTPAQPTQEELNGPVEPVTVPAKPEKLRNVTFSLTAEEYILFTETVAKLVPVFSPTIDPAGETPESVKLVILGAIKFAQESAETGEL